MSLEGTGVLLIGLPTTMVDDDTTSFETVSDGTALEELVNSGATEAA